MTLTFKMEYLHGGWDGWTMMMMMMMMVVVIIGGGGGMGRGGEKGVIRCKQN